MSKVTIYTSRLIDRDKQTAREEILKGNMVRIYPTCLNKGRSDIIKYQSEELFRSLGASPVEQDDSEPAEEYQFFQR